MWAKMLSIFTGSLFGQLRQAYEAKLKASNETERLVADVAIKDIERQIEERRAAKDIRLATAVFWEMRLITAVIAGCVTLHFAAVSLDTVFGFGWGIPRYPPPMDEWEATILLSFFGLQAGATAVNALAAAIRGRK